MQAKLRLLKTILLTFLILVFSFSFSTLEVSAQFEEEWTGGDPAIAVSYCAGGPNSTPRVDVSWSPMYKDGVEATHYNSTKNSSAQSIFHSNPSFVDTDVTVGGTYNYGINPEDEAFTVLNAGVQVVSTCTATLSVSAPSNASWSVRAAGVTVESGTGSNSFTTRPNTSGTTYSINVASPPGATVTNSDGGSTSLVLSPGGNKGFTINVEDPQVEVELTASPASVATGGASTLSWSSTNATSCIASGGWSGTKPTSGSQSVSPTAQSTTYTIECTNSSTGQSAEDDVTITVTANPPIVDLTINGEDNDIVIVNGESFDYLASAENVGVYCGLMEGSTTLASSNTGSGGNHSDKTGVITSSSPHYPTVSSPKTFTFSCSSPDNSSTIRDSIAVSVGGDGGGEFNFSIPFPGDMYVEQGESESDTINANLVSGTAQNVSFSMSPEAVLDLPPGTSASFSPGSCMLGCSTTLTIQTSASTPLGSHEVGVRGTATGGLVRAQTFFINVTGPGEGGTVPQVSLVANPTTVQPGGSSTLNWSSTNADYCTASGGWSGTKSTSGSQSVSPSGTTTYTIFCYNDSTGENRGDSAEVIVGGSFNYRLLNSGTIYIPAGGSETNTITKELTGGSTQAVNLSAYLHPGITITDISDQGCSPDCVSIIEFSVHSSVTPGGYPINVYGLPLNRATQFYIMVEEAGEEEPPVGTFDYELENSGTTRVTKGGTNTPGQNVIDVEHLGGTSAPVTITATGMPSGVSVGYSPTNRTCTPDCIITINFTVSPTAQEGNHTIRVTGSPLGETTQFILDIDPSPNIVVSCSASPTSPLIGQTVTWTASASGGVPPYTYTWSGTNVPTNPAPVTSTGSYNITYSTVGQKNVTTTVRDSLSNTGTCSPPGTVYVNFDPRFEEF